jgi:hypothetical protein
MELTSDHQAAIIDPDRPLLIVDVDEVLALFMEGFGRFIERRGYELRIVRFGLLQNIYRQGETASLEADAARGLLDDFFRIGCEHIEPTPHAADSLRDLSRSASVVILTNAPEQARAGRARWLARHAMDYPLIFNTGPKGEAVAALAGRTRGPAAFVDDLLGNLESAAQSAPQVRRFQFVADARLQPLAPSAPERHRRIDHWPSLASEIAAALEPNAP